MQKPQSNYMDNSVTMLFERGDPSEFNYGSPLYYRRGRASNQNWIDLDEGEGFQFSTMDVINE